MERNWLFDELKYAGEEHLSADQVAWYDQKQQFDPAGEVRDLQDLGLFPSHTVVDLGAGTGVFALEIAKHCRRVVAVDIAPAMLAVVRKRAEQAGIRNLEVAQAGFLTYEHQGEKADLVYSRNALHHLPDFWKVQALVRMTRLLKPGGILRLRDLVYSFDPRTSVERLEKWISRAPTDPREGVPRHELEAHVRCEYSTYTWLLESMLERVGFDIIEAAYSPSEIFAVYTCRVRK